MLTAPHQRRVLELCAIEGLSWSKIGRASLTEEGLAALWASHAQETSSASARVVMELQSVPPDGHLATALDEDFPARLKKMSPPLPFIFTRGNVPSDAQRAVAVVGTRKASQLGIARARDCVRLLVSERVAVVSGLALGIDTAAHDEAVASHGTTVAVLGTGIGVTYPPQNQQLAEAIISSGGALVSQFWPSAAPATANFPQRNAVTASLSDAVVVIEASGRSGAFDCARRALQQGRLVMLMSDLVVEERMASDLIARGARHVSSAEDVLHMLLDIPAQGPPLRTQEELPWGTA